jgi:hypothetical protein
VKSIGGMHVGRPPFFAPCEMLLVATTSAHKRAYTSGIGALLGSPLAVTASFFHENSTQRWLPILRCLSIIW